MITTIRDHTFFTNRLGPDSIVLDLGANRGEFAQEITRRYGVSCLAVEPNSELAGSITPTDRIRVRRLAIADRDGPVDLQVSDETEASSLYGVSIGAHLRTEEVPGMSFSSLLVEEGLHQVDLAKVDIEGAEVPLFLATPADVLKRVAQFNVEFHDFTGAVSADQMRQVIRRLTGLGFRAIKFSRINHNWLFFQLHRSGVRTIEAMATRYVVRNVRGALRQLPRGLGHR